RHGLAVMLAATVWGLAIVAFGLCDWLLPALGFLTLAGGADAVSGIFRMTMWNQTIPDALRGRLAAIEMVSYMSGPLLGHAEAGAVAALFRVRASVVSGGVLCVVGVRRAPAALRPLRGEELQGRDVELSKPRRSCGAGGGTPAAPYFFLLRGL